MLVFVRYMSESSDLSIPLYIFSTSDSEARDIATQRHWSAPVSKEFTRSKLMHHRFWAYQHRTTNNECPIATKLDSILSACTGNAGGRPPRLRKTGQGQIPPSKCSGSSKNPKSPAVRGFLIWVFNFENLLNLFEKYSVDKKKKIYLHIFSE